MSTNTIESPSSPGQAAASGGASLWSNRAFKIYWAGRSLATIGDACALIALPLLVLQATGSIMQMGLVTGTYGAGHFAAGFFAGEIVDRTDRRKLMIALNLSSFLLYALIPLGWALWGPQVWLVYFVVGLGAMIDMVFQVAMVTMVPNLVRQEQITAANGRLSATGAIAFTVGPILAGVLSVQYGPVTAMGLDAVSFLVSAASLTIIRLRPHAAGPDPGRSAGAGRKVGAGHLSEGMRFIRRQPVLRAMALLLAGGSLFLPVGYDLFIFHLKHDLGASDDAVGMVFGLSSIGAIAAGLLVERVRKWLGFGACWLGGAALAGIAFACFGLAPMLLMAACCSVTYAFADSLRGIAALSLRQEITPDALLGRVASAFWMLTVGPGALGAAVATALAGQLGATPVMAVMGLGGLVVAAGGLLTPAPRRRLEAPALVVAR